MLVNDFLGHQQSQTRTPQTFCGKKGCENLLLDFIIHAASVIGHFIDNGAILFVGPHRYLAPGSAAHLAGIDGVAHKVGEAFMHAFIVDGCRMDMADFFVFENNAQFIGSNRIFPHNLFRDVCRIAHFYLNFPTFGEA